MFNSRQIKAGTILNDKYEIESILGEGGFGITYLAKDINMNEKVAIKEYFPSAFGTRDTTAGEATNEITVIKGEDKEAFEKGLRGFEDEASNLARFNKEAGIVSVKSFFKENNTGYMVMEYIDGVTLKDYLKEKGGRIPCLEAISMMKPVMDSLSLIHGKSIIHRDISPDNIMVTKNGTLKLIDFGAARYVGANDEKSLTVMLKAGFAPPEQYRTHGKQGAWTDIYALSATMCQMISGVVPEESIERIMGNDNVIALNKLCPDVPENISKAIEKGMSVQAEDRYQSIEELQASFSAGKQITTNKKSINKKYIYALAGIVAVVIVEVFVFARSAEKSEIETKLFEETVAEDTVTTSDVNENNSDETVEEMAEENDDEIVEEEAEEKYLYTSAKVNIRSAPNEEKDNIIAVSEVGQEFEVLSRDVEGWITVKYEDDEAYINSLYMVTEDDYNCWREHYEFIVSEWNRIHPNHMIEDDIDNYGLGGAYDDFDGDGEKELFVAIGFTWPYPSAHIWFADKNGVTDIGGIWNYYDANENEIVDPRVYWGSVSQYGKIKMCFIGDYYMSTEYSATLLLDNGKPVVDTGDQIVEDLGGIAMINYWGNLNVYSSNGDEYVLYCGSGNQYYPVIYQNGEWKEIASCEVSIEDFYKIDKADSIVNDVKQYFYEYQVIDFIHGGTGGTRIQISSIDIDNILYNDMGYFVLNLKVNGFIDEEPSAQGARGYAIVKYDGDTYTLLHSEYGSIFDRSGKMNVLSHSECTWIE